MSSTAGNRNTAVGQQALLFTTGSDNVGLGFEAGQNQSSGSNSIYIGNIGAAESDTIRIGTVTASTNHSVHTATFIAGISGASVSAATDAPVQIDATGKLGTVISSRRFKEDIRDLGAGSRGLLRLRPVSFRYTPEQGRGAARQWGFIAEEVAEAFPELVIYDEGGQPFTVRYHLLPTLLLNELQRQERELAALRAELAELRARVEALGTPRRAARADE